MRIVTVSARPPRWPASSPAAAPSATAMSAAAAAMTIELRSA
jgi:hypothetical protein